MPFLDPRPLQNDTDTKPRAGVDAVLMRDEGCLGMYKGVLAAEDNQGASANRAYLI